jgi:hypothetical protein
MVETVRPMSQKIVSIENNVAGHRVLEMLSEGRKIADLKSTDLELQSGEFLKNPYSFPRWTSTIVVNEKPGVPFGKTVKFWDDTIVFNVPKEYQGIKNAFLVLDSSTVKLTKQGFIFEKELVTGKVLKSQSYPEISGWYLPDQDMGLPTTTISSPSNPEARQFELPYVARIGPVACHGPEFGGERYVSTNTRFHNELSVAFVEQDSNAVPARSTMPARSGYTVRIESATNAEPKLPQIISTEAEVSGHRVLVMLAGGRHIADNRSVDVELQTYESNKRFKSFPRLTSTIVVNEAPDKAFGETVEYDGVVFNVPEEFRGMKNTALVLDSSTIALTKQNGKELLSGKIFKSQSYPTARGCWFLPDPDTGIPTAEWCFSSNPDARRLARLPEAHIGPVVRWIIIDEFDTGTPREIDLAEDLHSSHFAVAFVEHTVPNELLSAVRASLAKLETTVPKEVTDPINQLLRVL